MRKYLLPAMKYASRALPQPSDLRVFMIKRRTVALSMAMSFLIVTAMGMMAVNAAMDSDAQNVTKHEDHAKGKSASTSVTTNVPLDINDSKPSSTDAKTNVTVNGEQVQTTSDGNYSKTITTDNGTTHINVSNNSGSAGSGFTSSMSTTHTNISSNSFTNDVHIHTSP